MTTCMPAPANTSPSSRRLAGRGPNALQRLIQITQSNDRLAVELAKSRRRLEQALHYATDPKSSASLGVALIAHCQKKHNLLVRQLRSNRAEAIAVLAGIAADA